MEEQRYIKSITEAVCTGFVHDKLRGYDSSPLCTDGEILSDQIYSEMVDLMVEDMSKSTGMSRYEILKFASEQQNALLGPMRITPLLDFNKPYEEAKKDKIKIGKKIKKLDDHLSS